MPYKSPARQRQAQREWYASRRRHWLAMNGPCRCKAPAEEVHHREQHKKVSHRVWSWSSERRAAELQKCDALCRPCHLQESKKQRPPTRIHGTRAMYVQGRCRCDACRKANSEYAKWTRSLNAFPSPILVSEMKKSCQMPDRVLQKN
jgi:hypothetical protein